MAFDIFDNSGAAAAAHSKAAHVPDAENGENLPGNVRAAGGGETSTRNPRKTYDKTARLARPPRSTLAAIVTNDDERERQRGKRIGRRSSLFLPCA